MMPQKKNPDLAELIRAKSGRILGDLVAMLTVLKGLPLSYDSDLQEDKEPVFDALDALKPSIELTAKLWPAMKFKVRAMREAAGGWALATDLAEYLTRRGVPFREAHETIGALVRDLAASGRSLDQIGLDELRGRSPAFRKDVMNLLSPENSLRARRVIGGPAPSEVRRRLRELKAQ